MSGRLIRHGYKNSERETVIKTHINVSRITGVFWMKARINYADWCDSSIKRLYITLMNETGCPIHFMGRNSEIRTWKVVLMEIT